MNEETPGQPEPQHKQRLAAVSLAALGVVFGDIGTSPLYTLKAVFNGPYAVPVTAHNVYGILSLVFWALILVVAVKYITFIMRADNNGEGGIMALTSLALRTVSSQRKAWCLSLLGIFGTALFYGDGMIAPAISVLSAVEGLSIATPALEKWVIPLALTILIALFAVQRFGTGRVGAFFGPVMLCWFIVLAVLGVRGMLHHPEIVAALNPWWAVRFIVTQPLLGWLTLGAVVLAITGGEALYTDMGYFGRNSIRLAWFGVVLPSLYLNYLGQGAMILDDPGNIQSPFYKLVPSMLLVPMVCLATVATVIASQAVISGAFSLTRQAIQLSYAPRMHIVHTSAREIGQIYVPGINWMLLGAVALLVIGFGSSDALASAYGIAVTLTMTIDTLLVFIVMRGLWKWGRGKALLFLAVFLTIDIGLFSATLVKVLTGGWFALLVAGVFFVLLAVWRRGYVRLRERIHADDMPLDSFLRALQYEPPARVEGTAVFMTAWTSGVPHALLHNMVHNKVLHERVILLSVQTADVPYVPREERINLQPQPEGFYLLRVNYGFKEDPDVPAALEQCADQGLVIEIMSTSFFLGRASLITRNCSGLSGWWQRLFVLMYRNASSVSDFFNIPPNRVVELGTQVEL